MIVAGLPVLPRHLADVRLLLWSLHDYEPEPLTASGKITARAGATRVAESPPATYTTRCDACGGDGAHGNGRRCPYCGGAGRREWPRLHDPERPETLSGDPQATLVNAITRRDRRGSYHALELAMRSLADAAMLSLANDRVPVVLAGLDGRLAHRLLVTRYVVLGSAGDPFAVIAEDAYRQQVEFGLTYVAWRILQAEGRLVVPVEVRRAMQDRERWAQTVKGTRGRARELRDREIRRLARVEGWQVPALARRYGLSRRAVQEIVYGRTVAA